jgi:hypothetical protein
MEYFNDLSNFLPRRALVSAVRQAKMEFGRAILRFRQSADLVGFEESLHSFQRIAEAPRLDRVGSQGLTLKGS